MTPATFIAALEANAPNIAGLVRAIPPERARWRPNPADWSVLEVVNHLADEETEDFRARLDTALHRPGTPVPPNDPAAWPVARAYNERDLAASLARFLDERQRSLAWLRGLADPDWSNTIRLENGGALRAGDLLASWAAHDLLHLRQLVELQYATSPRGPRRSASRMRATGSRRGGFAGRDRGISARATPPRAGVPARCGARDRDLRARGDDDAD